ncbi:MAG: amino acid permease, partial [Desulfarculaceae bacterium]
MAKHAKPGEKPSQTQGLGTFAGVFTPSILTILGIILFLRLGFVVGSAGLSRALIIIALANAISVLTSVSLSAISTNLKVKGGGDYYLISRTLGVEFGGAIGVVLFLAQSVSVAFYCLGFAELTTSLLPPAPWAKVQLVAAAAVACLFGLAWLGADWATKFQYVVMTILGLALASFFIGALPRMDASLLAQNWSGLDSKLGFWALFAIFFPAVTGFTQGVSMSGDLRDPGRSLPLGTFGAVGISIIIYFGVAFVFAACLPKQVLAGDYLSMKRIAWLGFLIQAGVIAATLSSAMASFLGAPRILQSLARDRTFSFLVPFAKGYGPMQNPRRGVLLSAGIAFATIALGELNVIAPVVTMFFLISYGLLNYATYYEARAASPSFRPTFRWFDRRLSLIGSLACLGVMLAIDLSAGAMALALLAAVYQYLKRTAGPARWADSRRSFHLQQAREHLLAAASEVEHPRDWRPIVLAFSDHEQRRQRLLQFSTWLEGGSGLTTAVRVLEGEGAGIRRRRRQTLEALSKELTSAGLKAFPLVVNAPDLSEGIDALIQASGLGPLKPNLVLVNWPQKMSSSSAPDAGGLFITNLRTAFHLGCNLVILDAKESSWDHLQNLPSRDRCIDIWWEPGATGHLMLLLAYLISKSRDWEESPIRVLAYASGPRQKELEETLHSTLADARIQAQIKILDPDSNQSLSE